MYTFLWLQMIIATITDNEVRNDANHCGESNNMDYRMIWNIIIINIDGNFNSAGTDVCSVVT